MSSEEHEASACFGKPVYKTMSEAQRVLRLRNHRPGKKRRKSGLAPYRCPFCHQYHIGGPKPL